MVLFITLNNTRWYQLPFKSVDEILKCDHSNESYWAVLSCGTVNTLYKVVLTFESVDEILKCDHLNESPSAAFYCGAVYYAVQGGSSSVGVAGDFLVTKGCLLVSVKINRACESQLLFFFTEFLLLCPGKWPVPPLVVDFNCVSWWSGTFPFGSFDSVTGSTGGFQVGSFKDFRLPFLVIV